MYSRECCIRFIDFDLFGCREEVKEQEKRDTPAVNNIDSELVAYDCKFLEEFEIVCTKVNECIKI